MSDTDRATRLIVITLALAATVSLLAIFTKPAAADGVPVKPPPAARAAPPPIYGPPPATSSCLMNAAQLGYQTGKRELAYAASEACAMYAGSRGFVLPYSYYGPYVPEWTPSNWVLPPRRYRY